MLAQLQLISKDMKLQLRAIVIFCLMLWGTGCARSPRVLPLLSSEPVTTTIINPIARKLVAGGIAQTDVTKTYDPAYVALKYPGGDVPTSTGVCTDVIIRAYRQIGIDLQQAVHEDMRRNFAVYPKLWGLKQPDKNIDHRRVANLMTFFDRRGASLPITGEYLPGDLVTYDLGERIGLHIAIVTNIKTNDGYQMVHNACCGTKVETLPRSWKINGHYRYLPRV
jgi:uncharacterized protein